ncbi:MAG: hypothetical protein ACE5DS_00065 [Kiloniellaceae bacterium]
MTTMGRAASAALVAAMLTVPAAGASAAEDEPSAGAQAEKMARDAMERMMRTLELLFQSVPQYELPEITDDGDIIIRRKHPPAPDEKDQPRDKSPDSTRT